MFKGPRFFKHLKLTELQTRQGLFYVLTPLLCQETVPLISTIRKGTVHTVSYARLLLVQTVSLGFKQLNKIRFLKNIKPEKLLCSRKMMLGPDHEPELWKAGKAYGAWKAGRVMKAVRAHGALTAALFSSRMQC